MDASDKVDAPVEDIGIDWSRIVDVAVLVPCYNEAHTISTVVADFKSALPNATIYVYDNNSSDSTTEKALEAGAIVRKETRQGKGYVVRRMFSDIEADVFILVDGDATYDASAAQNLLQTLVLNGLDMVSGARRHVSEEAYRPGHVVGNRALTGIMSFAFNAKFQDMLSGYRVLSKRFVKSFPLMSRGFEIETELTVHALELDMPLAEIETNYFERPEGSVSKLNTFGDGFRILAMIFHLLRRERPMTFFGLIALAAFLLASVLIYPVITEYLRTGLVPRFPTYFTAILLFVVSLLSLFSGVLLNAIRRARHEAKRMQYLSLKSVVATAAENQALQETK